MIESDRVFVGGLIAGACGVVALALLWLALLRPLLAALINADKPAVLWARMRRPHVEAMARSYAGGVSFHGVSYRQVFVGVQVWHRQAVAEDGLAGADPDLGISSPNHPNGQRAAEQDPS